jgi:hypothetical protein
VGRQCHIILDEGLRGAVLRAFDQGLPDTTDRRDSMKGRHVLGSPMGGEREL